MDNQTVLIIASIIASVLLSTVSNWFYDLLRDKGIFSTKRTLKTLLVITAAGVPLVLLMVLPEVTIRDRESLALAMRAPVPLWMVIILCVIMAGIGFFSIQFKLRKISNQLDEAKKRLHVFENPPLTKRGSKELIIKPRQ